MRVMCFDRDVCGGGDDGRCLDGESSPNGRHANWNKVHATSIDAALL